MATYIVLLNYTQQGIQNIKESPARFDAAKKAIQSMGADIKQVFLRMGQYGLVAFTEDEFRKLFAGLP